jgi:hypothetical protein
MEKKVLILEGSARINRNTDLLSSEFMKGAESVGFADRENISPQ